MAQEDTSRWAVEVLSSARDNDTRLSEFIIWYLKATGDARHEGASGKPKTQWPSEQMGPWRAEVDRTRSLNANML